MFKNTKKLLALTLATVLAAGCLSGCGGSSSGASGGKTKLSFGIWDKNQQPAMQAMVDAYTKENPDVTIEIQITPYKGQEYFTKLDASMNGGTAPDIFWMNAMHLQKYVDGGMLEPLEEPMSAAGIDATQFPESLLKLYTIDGKKYAVPKDFDTNALWYNKEIFDNAGVPYPTDDWTWEDMVAAGQKLGNKEKGIYALGASLDYQTNYYNTVFACGGFILNDEKTTFGYNDPGTVEGIQCWIDLINDGLSPDVNQTTETTQDAMFEAGSLAMNWAGSYMTPEFLSNETIKDKIDLVEAPAYKGKKANVINGLGYCVFSKSKNKEEAVKFAMWLGGAEAMKIQGESGVVIAARNDAQHYFADAHPEINLNAYLNQAQLATPLPAFRHSGELIDIEYNYMKQAFAGQMTLQEACDALQQEATALLTQ